jgi:hypothetical protein
VGVIVGVVVGVGVLLGVTVEVDGRWVQVEGSSIFVPVGAGVLEGREGSNSRESQPTTRITIRTIMIHRVGWLEKVNQSGL